MEGLPVRNFEVKSYKGNYSVEFKDSFFEDLKGYEKDKVHFIVDEKLFYLYEEQFKGCLNESPLLIEATEYNKDLVKIPHYIEFLMANGIRRDHTIVAIGGGIIQDISCFLATNLYRGIDWHLYPTTLLAQADSCIGSKSSINVEKFKNLVGAFNPPAKIIIANDIRKTLTKDDLASGVGEILKVHMIDGKSTFEDVAKNYEGLFNDEETLQAFIYKSLMIKRNFIEIDEFDKKERNVMNYGHGFGHAIESATNFEIPHGIAVTIGMHMANSYSFQEGMISKELFELSGNIFKKNYENYRHVKIPREKFYDAFSKDKKNKGKQLALILASESKPMAKYFVDADEKFKKSCESFFTSFEK